jgi:hypothetical protein
VEELQRSEPGGSELLNPLIILIGVVLISNTKLIRVYHDEQMVNKLLLGHNLEEL